MYPLFYIGSDDIVPVDTIVRYGPWKRLGIVAPGGLGWRPGGNGGGYRPNVWNGLRVDSGRALIINGIRLYRYVLCRSFDFYLLPYCIGMDHLLADVWYAYILCVGALLWCAQILCRDYYLDLASNKLFSILACPYLLSNDVAHHTCTCNTTNVL